MRNLKITALSYMIAAECT